MGNKKRLGIFCLYDKDGMVGEYVKVYLQSVLPYLTDLAIVINGELGAEGERSLREFTDQIYMREDKGMDGGAYQDMMMNVLGMDYVRRYEELLLFNDTVYAPVNSWEPIFDKMEKTKADFWGLSQNENKSVPLHMQAYFVIFRSKLLHSEDFEVFWRNLDAGELDKNKVIANFEINLTYYLENRGYSWDTYSQRLDKDIFCNPHVFLAEEKLPIIKTNVFSAWADRYTTDEERRQTELYVKNHSSYNFALIEENLRHKEGRDFYQIKSRVTEAESVCEEEISWKDVVAYASQYREVFLYGNTLRSYIMKNLLQPGQIKGIVVSDEFWQEKQPGPGVPIYKFSEVQNHGEGLIVNLGYRNSKALKEQILGKFPEAIFYWNL